MTVRIRDVILATEQVFCLRQGTVKGRSRLKVHTVPRQAAMYVAHVHFAKPVGMIGRVFERDHSTVAHGVQRIAELTRNNPLLKAQIAQVVALSAKIAAGEVELKPRDVPSQDRHKLLSIPTRIAPATARSSELKDWYEANNERFSAVMRALYPKLENQQGG